MKAKLTNRITTLKFTQYGICKQMEYRGELKDAMSNLWWGHGCKPTSGKTITDTGFLIQGTNTVTIINPIV